MARFHSVYPHIIPDISKWPIYKLAQNRTSFIKELEEDVLQQFIVKYGTEIDKVIAKTIYLEKKRCKETPWKIDPSNELKYWSGLGKEFQENKLSSQPDIKNQLLLRKIINRYCEEIMGDFKISAFKFARRFLKALFTRLFTAAAEKGTILKFRTRNKVYDKIRVEGAIDKVRKLALKGTVIVVPTHLSNIDSILIGYAMDGVAGLPAFSYGAGLNLYDLELVAYFMDRLGAYKVDRRKKNPIYLETLKNMSKKSIEKGVNSLFFPGGTRSRSGCIEDNLKMGLLGTIIEAQRSLFQEGKDDKIFIVPLTMSYNFVLEGKYLIENHLQNTGREKYIKIRDQAKSYRKYISFFWKLFSASSEIYLAFSEPMDVFGNRLDNEGRSYNHLGKEVDLKEYFMINGSLITNTQRESVYTKKLADKIIEAYRHSSIVLASHLVAYCAFKWFENQHPKLDIYDLVNLSKDTLKIPRNDFHKIVEMVWNQLKEKEKKGETSLLAKHKQMTIDELVEDGIKSLGIYHDQKPLIYSNGFVMSQDYKLLYFYHNRMTHFSFNFNEEAIKVEELIFD